MEGKNCPRGSEKLVGAARANRGSDIPFSAPELENRAQESFSGDFFDGLSLWVVLQDAQIVCAACSIDWSGIPHPGFDPRP